MVLLEAIGLASKELFDYNRENFKFDQEQRLERDMQRVEMQIKRFDLFREDIEDLVNLTVRKMDMYHLVASLFLGFGAIIYTEGRYEFEASKPTFFLKIYFLSVNGALMFFLLSVWLSMYASISSHSFGVRVRTRYVRLPIPSLSQITGLTAKLSDFERQGINKVMRVPFIGNSAEWKHRPEAQRRPETTVPAQDVQGAEQGFTEQRALWKAADAAPGKHVQLYRSLQSKWQVYDAYARVSMWLGLNQMTKAVNYFVISVTLIQNYMTMASIAATAIFQAAALSVCFLDIANMEHWVVFVIQMVGTLPITITVLMLAKSWEDHGGEVGLQLNAEAWYFKFAPVAFVCEAVWLQCLLRVAHPYGQASLPYNLRAVLFLDVFGDAAYDPTEAEHARTVVVNDADDDAGDEQIQEELSATAFHSLHTAFSALRRWEAVPENQMSSDQIEKRGHLRGRYMFWRRRLLGHYTKRLHKRGQPFNPELVDVEDLREWRELSAQEQQEDEFAKTLLGPLPPQGRGATECHYDLEGHRCISGRVSGNVLTLNMVEDCIRSASDVVQELLNVSSFHQKPAQERGKSTNGADDNTGDGDDEDSPRIRKARFDCCSGKERLPWKSLRRLTQTLQFCWLLLGVVTILEDQNWVPTYLHPSADRSPGWLSGRRLQASEASDGGLPEGAPVQKSLPMEFEIVQVQWPHGAFFRPSSMACTWQATPSLVISSPFLSYSANFPQDSVAPVQLRPLPRGEIPPGAALLCAAGGQPCLLGALEAEGIAIWPRGLERNSLEAVVLTIEGSNWTTMSGALVACDRVRGAMTQRFLADAPGSPEWCLLLAGFDGVRAPLAAVPLPEGPEKPPRPGDVIRPRLAAPLALQDFCGAVPIALHLEPRRGRLWAALRSGEFQSIELLAQGGVLKRWSVALQELGGGPLHELAGICEETEGGYLMLTGSGPRGPELLRAVLSLNL